MVKQEYAVSYWKVPQEAKDGEWEHSPDLRERDYKDRAACQDLCFTEEEFSLPRTS